MSVHPSAIVEAGAKLGAGVKVGPFCVVGSDVTLGDGVELISHAVVTGRTSVGARTVVFPFASVGHRPQDLKYAGEPSTLTIGTDCVITGLDGRTLVELSEGRGLSPSYARWPELKPALGRYVLSCSVRRAGLPEPLANEAMVLSERDARGSERPALHLQSLPATGRADDALCEIVVEACWQLSCFSK